MFVMANAQCIGRWHIIIIIIQYVHKWWLVFNICNVFSFVRWTCVSGDEPSVYKRDKAKIHQTRSRQSLTRDSLKTDDWMRKPFKDIKKTHHITISAPHVDIRPRTIHHKSIKVVMAWSMNLTFDVKERTDIVFVHFDELPGSGEKTLFLCPTVGIQYR